MIGRLKVKVMGPAQAGPVGVSLGGRCSAVGDVQRSVSALLGQFWGEPWGKMGDTDRAT